MKYEYYSYLTDVNIVKKIVGNKLENKILHLKNFSTNANIYINERNNNHLKSQIVKIEKLLNRIDEASKLYKNLRFYHTGDDKFEMWAPTQEEFTKKSLLDFYTDTKYNNDQSLRYVSLLMKDKKNLVTFDEVHLYDFHRNKDETFSDNLAKIKFDERSQKKIIKLLEWSIENYSININNAPDYIKNYFLFK